MAKGYSKDLRARAVALVEDGESRREAARVLGLGASTAIRWVERWATTGSVAARLKSEKWRKTGTTSVWRFYERHYITFKTHPATAEQDRPDVTAARPELKVEQSKLDALRLVGVASSFAWRGLAA